MGPEWTLQLNGGQPISLYKGASNTPHVIHAKVNPEDYPNGDYAQVACKETKGPLFLFNDSKDIWSGEHRQEDCATDKIGSLARSP